MPEISAILLNHLAAMICGDTPHNEHFPYRTSSGLTKFFQEIWLDFRHDGSTRRNWVEWVLHQIASPPEEDYLSKGKLVLTDNLAKVIVHIVNPLHFVGKAEQHKEAVKRLNEVLAHTKLCVVYDDKGRASVVPVGIKERYPGQIMAPIEPPKIAVIRPTVFRIPDYVSSEQLRCAVLMPFNPLLDEVYREHIAPAIKAAGFTPMRADEIWKDSVLINDIFELIFSSKVVVVDLTGRNPNVMYELGIAHTLGREVVPIVQNPADVPFDVRHHRYLRYEATASGRQKLASTLEDRMRTIRTGLAAE